MQKQRRFRNSVGKQISKHRVAAKLTQDALTTKLQLAGLDIERTGIAKIESQVRSVFDHELYVIARVLGVNVQDLYPSEREFRKDLPRILRGYF